MYSQNILDEIKDKLSIVALVGERIPLKKAGRNFKGCCPFHSEKTPSFMVSDEKQIYHCFGCGEGGNIFNFFMKFDNLSFKESVEMLAERAGVKLPVLKRSDEDQLKESEAEKNKRWSLRLNQIVAEYYHNNLMDKAKGEAARNYLKSRGINLEKITQHFLGYADDSWDQLVSFLEAKKVPLDLAVSLGLIKRREKDGGYYDFFRHRIMCPVIAPSFGKKGKIGQVVAFSGRTFGRPQTSEGREDPAKYLNSPDSIVYHKSYTVFGLNAAVDAVRREDRIILVEGNLDVLRLHQEGILNVVAPLGTALTSGHLNLLKRFTKNFVVVFDGDEAGKKATKRCLPVFLELGLVPRTVVLENGEDPDSFVLKRGAKEFRSLIDDAEVLFDWVIDDTVLVSGGDADGKVRAVEELKGFFELVRNPVEASVYRKRLATKLAVEESVVMQSLAGRPSRLRAKTEVSVAQKKELVEKSILELMLTYPETAKYFYDGISPDFLMDGAYQTMAKMLFAEFEKYGTLDVSKIAEEIADPEMKREILSLAMSDAKYEDPIEAAKECIAAVKRSSAKRRLFELCETVRKMGGNDPNLTEYMNEIQNINRELHNVS